MIIGFFTGHIGRDAEIREYGGRRFVSFSVATRDVLRSGTTRTWWVSVTFSNENMATHLRKGRQVHCTGRLSFSVYNGEVQIECAATYLELLDKKDS